MKNDSPLGTPFPLNYTHKPITINWLSIDVKISTFIYTYFNAILNSVEGLTLIYGIFSYNIGITSNWKEVDFLFI